MDMAHAYLAIAGCVGGALPDVLRLIEGRHGQVPTYLTSLYFWVSLVLLVIIGGAAGFFGTQASTEPSMLSALAYGYSAPSVLSRLLSDPAGRTTERSLAGRRSLRSWWAS
jgi:hypothetical protein